MSGIPAPGGLKKPAASVSKIRPPAGIQPPGSLSGRTGTPGTLSNASSASNLASETESGTKLGGQAAKDPSDILTHDPDDFIIGDRVWVNGTKPGYIQFIGETKFAAGDWAGIVLDEPIGKNDGSVSGVRYFQCEPRRGVFARLQRLTRYPMSGHNGPNDSTLIQEAPGKSITTRTVVRPCSPGAVGRVTPTSPPRAVITNTESVAVDHGLRIGDRVIVNASSGFKNGTLRFIGATEFAQGHWCGVELDEPVGKNDGSVNGKRYFACRSKYGLFAPVHKVAREGGHTTTTVHTTTRTTKVTSPPRMVTRTGSRESIASNVSSTSSHSIRRSKPRLGVTSLAAGERHSGQQSQQQGQSTNKVLPSILSPNQGVLQDALREKEEHIEQLLKERDLEQTEIARVTAQMEETEAKLDTLKAEYAKATETFAEEREALKKQLKHTERECDELNRKIEDLQFALEEIEINKADADQERKNLLEKVADLEKMLQSGADAKSPEGQANLKLVEIEAKHRKEIDEYKRRLEDAHGEVKAFKDSVDMEKRAHKEVEKLISTKEAQLKSCDAELVKSKKACEELKSRVEQLENELFEMAEKSQEVKGEEIEELRNKLKDGEKKLIEERQSLLKTQKERTDLLAQCDIFERQIKDIQKQNDAYREELAKLSEHGGQLTTKLEGEIEVLKKKLRDTEASLNQERDTKAELLEKKDTLEFQVEETSSKLEELEKNLRSSKTYVEQLEDEKKTLKAEVESLLREASEKELRALSSEKTSDGLLQEKIAEAERYRSQISERDDKISQLSRSLNESQNEVTSLGNELDSLRSKLDSERRNSETALKKAEHECQSMRFELENTSESLKTELDNLKKLYDQSLKDAEMSRKKLKANEEERNDLQAKISKLLCDLENARSTKETTYGEMSELRKEISDLKLKICEIDNAKSTAIRECEREKERCRSLEQKIANSEAMMNREQGDAKRQIEDLEERLAKAQNLHKTLNDEHLSKTRQATNEINELRDCIKNLKDNLSDLERQVAEARRNDESLRSANDRLKSELDSINRMVAASDSERERQMERMFDEKRASENKLQNELQQALNETDRLRRNLDDERNRLEDLKTELDIKSEKLSRAEDLIRKNESERKEQVLNFKSQMENLRSEFDRYRRTLEENLEETKITSSHIEGQREVVEELHRQLSLKEVEAQQKSSEVSSLLLRIEDLERRNQKHLDEISRLEALSRQSRSRSKSPLGGDGDVKRVLEEKDSQIDFLNSIIVDMQRKNDDYRARIQILETNPTEFKTAASPLTKNGKVKTVRPPRLFCDICEVFDRHDTDDCPQQASEVVDHSKHQGSRGPSNRPYCDNCETFGHEASQCEIEEF